MSNINTVAISGNTVADPELRTTPSGFSIANLRVAVNHSKKQEDGSYADEASFFDVTVLGKYAETVASKVRKGDKLTVMGRLEQQRWQNDAGENRSKVGIIANEIDGEAMYRKAGEAPATTASNPAAQEMVSSAVDDDIPF